MAGSFLDRWSRRKSGEKIEPEKKSANEVKQALEVSSGVKEPLTEDDDALPPASLDDAEKMDPFAPDFSAFMKPDVDPAVQQAAMKKMFSDPHFNIMDGLDIYIDDYSKPDPIPLEMLKRMVQSDMLNIFRKDNVDEPEATTVTSTNILGSEEPTLPASVQTDLTSTSTPTPIQEAGTQAPLTVDKKTS
jgi:hypothetical protein